MVEGEGAIATMRKTIGATNPADADPGTIRGDLATAMPNNLDPRLRFARVGAARDLALVRRRELGRMRTLLAALGDPQLAYPAIHVVGTNGKSTATRTIEALLLAEGLSVGATVSPHVRSWAERITVDGAGGGLRDFDRARAAGGRDTGGDAVRDVVRGRVRRVRRP